ncbi:hypothetical protein GCM10009665_33900 [Kitasatospora nipponensis]|uniref:PRC-barrel domain protein n=1 Tax=Kitasatospora nipponensis TaxID=258049 RepID=A0ABP4GVT2_9ACTN
MEKSSERDERMLLDADSLIGFRVEATDGHCGHVSHHTAGVGAGHLVVDTGVWIFGSIVKLPLSTIARVEPDPRTVWLTLSKEQLGAEYRRQTDAYYNIES